MPQIGEVDSGYRFKGGDPAKPESWERASPAAPSRPMPAIETLPPALQRARREASAEAGQPTPWKQTVSDVSKGVSQAMLDPLEGTAQLATHIPIIGPLLRRIPGEQAVSKGAAELKHEAEKTTTGQVSRAVGDVANPLYWLGPTGGASALGRIAAAAGSGAAASAAQPVDDDKDFWTTKLEQTGVGVGIGALLRGAGELGRVLKSAPPPPTLEEFNLGEYRHVLEPIGQQANAPRQPGMQGLEKVRDIIGDELNAANRQLSFQTTPKFARDVTTLRNDTIRQITRDDARTEMNNLFDEVALGPLRNAGHALTGQQLSEQVSAIDKMAEQIAQTAHTSPDAYNRYRMADALHAFADLLESHADGPDAAKAARSRARDAYRRFIDLRNSPRPTDDGLATPGQILTQMRRREGPSFSSRPTPRKSFLQETHEAMTAKPPESSTAAKVGRGLTHATIAHTFGFPSWLFYRYALEPHLGSMGPGLAWIARQAGKLPPSPLSAAASVELGQNGDQESSP